MDCAQAKQTLLKAVEGELPQPELSRLREHLDGCRHCREEFEGLREASGALRVAVSELAPRETYLTPARLERLMGAHSVGPRIFKLATYRQFVAGAAAAAILISAAFIAFNLARMEPAADAIRGEQTALVRDAGTPPYAPPVVLVATGQGEPADVVRSLTVSGRSRLVSGESPQGARLLRADSAGVRIPVEHLFYDPEQSSRWW